MLPSPSSHISILAYFIARVFYPLRRLRCTDNTTELVGGISIRIVCEEMPPLFTYLRASLELRFTWRSGILYSFVHGVTRIHLSFSSNPFPLSPFPFSIHRFFTPYLYHCPRRTLTPYLHLLFLLPPFLLFSLSFSPSLSLFILFYTRGGYDTANFSHNSHDVIK